MKFNDYEHFKNYCLKIYRSKYDKKDIEYKKFRIEIGWFKDVYDFLNFLISHDEFRLHDIENDMLYNASKIMVNEGHEKLLEIIRILFEAIRKYNSGNLHIRTIKKLFYNHLKVRIIIDEELLFKGKFKNTYNNKSPLVSKHENYDFLKGQRGVYFIYDGEGKIAYIGKSANCILTRCFQSVGERKLHNYEKIELKIVNSDSDTNIYEAYYIGKYKPYKNVNMKFEDEITVNLPELETIYLFEKDLSNLTF